MSEFTASVGGSTDLTTAQDSTIKSTGDRVVGVRLLPQTIFASEQVCGETIIFDPPEASSIVSIVGGGGNYSIGPLQNQTRPIGETASLTGTGTETSECDPGFERVVSSATAVARVEEDGPGSAQIYVQSSGRRRALRYCRGLCCRPGSRQNRA